MKIYREDGLSNFDFWSGGKDNAELLTSKELDALTNILEDIYPDGMEETQINDLLWFDFKYVCELLGLEYDEDEDEIIRD